MQADACRPQITATRGVLLMNRKLLASAICASLLVTGAAYAQDNTAPQQGQDQSTTQSTSTQQKQEPKQLETVTVSGSLLKRRSEERRVGKECRSGWAWCPIQ